MRHRRPIETTNARRFAPIRSNAPRPRSREPGQSDASDLDRRQAGRESHGQGERRVVRLVARRHGSGISSTRWRILAAIQQEEVTLKSHGTIAHVMNEKKEPATAFILNRGEYDKKKDKVGADVPKSLPPMSADMPKNRLGFANWLPRPEYLLTARVTVSTASGKSCTGMAWSARRVTSASWGDSCRIRSCWIGWRSSSAKAAGTSRSSSNCS